MELDTLFAHTPAVPFEPWLPFASPGTRSRRRPAGASAGS